jgi:hypothetical protein
MTADTPDHPRASLLSSQANAEAAWQTLRTATFMLDMFDWDGVRIAMNSAHSVGHIIDPTGYKSLIWNPNVEVNAKLAAATHRFLCELRAIKEEAATKATKVKA